MDFQIHITAIYNCTLERAFKAPVLGDLTKVHTGFGPLPAVTGTTNDENWGKVGAIKNILAARSLTFCGGEVSTDKIVERIENEYWKLQVGNFKTWMFQIWQFTVEWATKELGPNLIQIRYSYTVHANGVLLIPFQWLFAKLFFKRYMRQVLENVRKMAEGDEPFLFD